MWKLEGEETRSDRHDPASGGTSRDKALEQGGRSFSPAGAGETIGIEPEELRDALVSGQSIAEIAAAMAIKAGTIKSHLHRARRKMAAGEEER